MVKIQLSFKYAVFNVFRYTFFYKAKLKSDVTLRKTDNNTNTKKIWIQCKQTLLLIQYIYISSLDMTMLIQISKIYATKWHEYANMC